MKVSKPWLKIVIIAIASTSVPSISSTLAFVPPSAPPRLFISTSFSRLLSNRRGKRCLGAIPSKTLLFMSGDSNESKSLAKEGPWEAFLDEGTTGVVYYFNVDTGESSWDPPTATFPEVKMSRKDKKRMTAVREEYAKEQRDVQKKKDDETKATRDSVFNWFMGADEKNKVSPSSTSDTPSKSKSKEKRSSSKSKRREKRSSSTSTDEKSPLPFATDLGGLMKGLTKPQDSEDPQQEDKFELPLFSKVGSYEIASKVIPHPEKISWGGEDAVFCKGRNFGVFDGVSGAEKEDGLPLYSVTLAEQLKATAGKKALNAEELKSKLLDAAEIADSTATGASTALVASLGEDGFLRALNLGDSYLLVIRNGDIVARTKESIHYFDCPYQLAEECPDRPRDGTTLNVEILSGDTIVLGSDGVFDNLTDETICDIVVRDSSAASIAKNISDESRAIGSNPTAETPYAKLAKKNKYEEYASGLGGKVDDISCIVVKC